MTNTNTGTSYQDRLLDIAGEETPQAPEKTVVPEVAPDPEPAPAPAATPEPEPIPEPEPKPEPAPAAAETPEWAVKLMEQQSEIIGTLQKLAEKKPEPPAPPKPVTPPISLKPLEQQIQSLREAVGSLEKTNVDVLRDSKNFQADSRVKMQRELDAYHKLFAEDVFAPLLTEMAKIYINCWKCITALNDEKLRENLQDLLLESMLELFEDNGVDVHQTAVGTMRSLRSCKTRKTVPTGDETLHGAVALSLNPSFSMGRMVLVKEVVDTYVYDPALKPAEPAEPAGEPAEEPGAPEPEAAAEPVSKEETTTTDNT